MKPFFALPAAAVLCALALPAHAGSVSCKLSDGADKCRTGLLDALKEDPPDFIVVLGAGPGASKTRAQGAAALFHGLGENAQLKIILSGLNPHNAPDLGNAAGRKALQECRTLPNARPRSEAELMCAYIRVLPQDKTVPLANLVLESKSGSTVANANNSAKIAKAAGAKHMLVVTTGYDRNYGRPVRPQSHARRALGDFCKALKKEGATFKLSGVDWPARGTPVWWYDVGHACGGR